MSEQVTARPQDVTSVETTTTAQVPPAKDPVDELIETRHTLTTPSGELSYTAWTGRIVLHEEEVKDGVFGGLKAKAQLSVTAYTLDDQEVTQRPITFVFNGGPGSSSLWLHMGLLGPRRVDSGDVGAMTPPPYRLVDNPGTLLIDSDLVFIDPMSTGHSRVVEGHKAKDYHGFLKDVEQVADLIRLWCTREDRWMSPKFILGESYGTVRAVAVAERLFSRYAMAVNGLVLISSVIDFGPQDFEPHRFDQAAIHFLPTYAAIAHYHGKHEGRSLEEVLSEAERYAAGRYHWVLARGRRLDPKDRADAVAKVAHLTGLSEDYVDRADLRIEHWRFCGELMREQGLAVGRIDGRFTGPLVSRLAEHMDADPSIDALVGPYAAAINHYLRGELESALELPYEVLASAVTEWSFKEFEGKPIDVTDKLERLMRAIPDLQVRVEYGYYDLATPYFAAEDTFAHLALDDQAWERISHAHFATGHMPYVNDDARHEELAGIRDFVRTASGR